MNTHAQGCEVLCPFNAFVLGVVYRVTGIVDVKYPLGLIFQ